MNKRHYEHTLPNIRGSLSNTYEDIDWDGLKAAGISKKQLEAEGNMELLLQGKETGIVPLKLHISVLSLTMDATLKRVPDGNGRPVMEINGLRQKEEAAV